MIYPHIVIIRWMATFLLDRTQQVKIGKEYPHSSHPNGGVLHVTLFGPKCFLVYINEIKTLVPLYKYVDDSTLFEVCDRKAMQVYSTIKSTYFEKRRDGLCERYFNKMKVSSHKLNHLLPDKIYINYDTRHSNKYPLPITRTTRYRHPLIPRGLHN